jgi:hypothetical protein
MRERFGLPIVDQYKTESCGLVPACETVPIAALTDAPTTIPTHTLRQGLTTALWRGLPPLATRLTEVLLNRDCTRAGDPRTAGAVHVVDH